MIKTGRLPIGLNTTPFDGSMAARIETELNLLLSADGLQTLPLDSTQETRERRRLFVAIARGVIGHIRDNLDAIDVAVPAPVALPTTVNPTLQVSDMP